MCAEMKTGAGVLKAKAFEDVEDYFPPSPRKKDWSIGLIRIVSVMVVFMAGVVLGLAVNTRFARYFSSQTDLFFPRTMYTPPAAGVAECDRSGEPMSMRGFVTPARLGHEMSDDELFWRASMVPRKEEYPFDRVPKVAFLFLTRGPLPFAPLWDRFFKGHQGFFSIYVHASPDYKLNVSRSSAFHGRQIPSEEVEWGSVSLLDAEKRLLANALLDFSNERFVLLSESCIPVYDFPTVYEYLTNSANSFVQAYDEDSWRGRGRYNRHMAPDIELTEWRKGSQWFELSRELAVNIVGDYKYYSLFRKYCRPSCYSDEHYLPTYLNMFHGSLNANRSVTWVDWSRGGPHPARYGREDITVEFIQSIRNNGTACSYNSKPTSLCFLFARKFSPSALGPLLQLSPVLMNF